MKAAPSKVSLNYCNAYHKLIVLGIISAKSKTLCIHLSSMFNIHKHGEGNVVQDALQLMSSCIMRANSRKNYMNIHGIGNVHTHCERYVVFFFLANLR